MNIGEKAANNWQQYLALKYKKPVGSIGGFSEGDLDALANIINETVTTEMCPIPGQVAELIGPPMESPEERKTNTLTLAAAILRVSEGSGAMMRAGDLMEEAQRKVAADAKEKG